MEAIDIAEHTPLDRPTNNKQKRIYQIFAGNKVNLFNQIKDNIGYFKELGINTIWLTPFHKSPSYHGYDIEDYFSIKESIGTHHDFGVMCATLKEHGIDVMLDLVICHTSDKHYLFHESTRGDYYNIKDIRQIVSQDSNNHDQSCSNKWHELGDRFYFAPFSITMPSLNLESPHTRQLVEDVVHFWKWCGVSHFRLDACLHASYTEEQNLSIWTWFQSIVGDSFTVGEVWSDSDTVKRYMEVLDSCFDFPTYYSILDNANEFNIAKVGETLRHMPCHTVRFSSNHDTNRLATTLNYSIERIKLALAINLFASENSCLYYGDELAMGGIKEINGDECVRGVWDLEEVKTHNSIKHSILNEYKRLVEIVKNNQVISKGCIEHIQEHHHYNKFDVVWLYNNKRTKIKFQRTSQNIDKELVIGTYANVDIAIKTLD